MFKRKGSARRKMKRIWRGAAFFLILGQFKTICPLKIIFSVLTEDWGGWHRVKGDQKEEEVLSSLGETPAANSQERAVRENQMKENEMLETEEEMGGDDQLDQKGNHEKIWKRGVEKKRRKSGVPKPIEDEIGTKKKKRRGKHTKTGKGKHTKKGKGKHLKKGKGKHSKKRKKQQKTGPKMKRKSQMCDNKYLEKKRLQLKVKAAKLKEQRSKISCANSTNMEGCKNKWAAYTRVSLGQAPNVIKQVEKYSFLSKHNILSGQFHPCQQ